MDTRLISWARAVKRPGGPPPLWLFTDSRRLPDPLPAIRRLPKGLCGVVLRHDGIPRRAALGREVAALCRARRLALTVAGDTRLAASLRAGTHLRGKERPPRGRHRGLLVTAAVHDMAQLRHARRAGAGLLFISPVFPTASHPGDKSLGGAGWRRLARHAGPAAKPCALGGIDGANIRRLGRACAAAGAIGALRGA